MGSTFWIELPIVDGGFDPTSAAIADGDEQTGAATGTAHAAPRTEKTVLYIEDNEANFDLVKNVLRHRPQIKLLAAMQGRSGLELAQRHRPDLILLDFHLPDINGDEVLRRLREEASTRDIPVIMVSADATPRQIERMLAAGAIAYLTKPLNVKQFLITLDENLMGIADGYC